MAKAKIITTNDESRYWLTLFTYATWQTFLVHGAKVVGFREKRWLTVQKIQPGDYLLCYLTGISRFCGVLAVTEPAFFDPTPIWQEDPLPSRVTVKPVITLPPESALPITELQEKLSIFDHKDKSKSWTAKLRRTPTLWQTGDGEAVMEALLDAKINPVVREFNARKLNRKPRGFGERVTVAQPTDEPYPVNISGFREPAVHTEIQWLLLKLGNDIGLDVWVARNDRGRQYGDNKFSTLPSLLNKLPRQFDSNTMRIVEHIDVLWLQGNAIVAAFEIESTTTIYSGLLRMADLISMQPNLNIPLYIVAPDERREKVFAEINRPTFSYLSPPLPNICRYIAFSTLRLKMQEAQSMLKYLRPEFIDDIAERCHNPSQSP